MTDFASLVERNDRAVQAHLGGSVTYAPTVGQPVTVKGVFDEAYERVDGFGSGVSSSGPAVHVTLADLPSDPATDVEALITINGQSYKAREVKPDGMGGAMLLLHRAA